jgi:2-polyprenyl-6-methoxyphenol hydroxylase-like FAD-dependent oxidoreductase
MRRARDTHYWVIGEEASGVLGRLDLADTWFASFPAAGDTGRLQDPSRRLRTLIGVEVDCEAVSTDDWTARMLLADRFAGDRVFLVGDAAHLNPPWGGHGFNTGVGDAVNIGWKPAAVLAGCGGADLLGSYDYERRIVANGTIDASSRHLRTTPVDLATPA